ncbi:hypothetical protein HMF7854_06255 [Sphingomonas ginkgonis]|uniref:Uncharacterized protein n=1 Tax=Sphingomonas ginkgonis TaxID=2315330 RepID=A0A429V9E7_9SPHN|nr:hypothetical protein [Sphingomonas ginkgonis]RST30477.1 hypothetical protein HMF7854_06255 [Sphingomonas ginkgonis]
MLLRFATALAAFVLTAGAVHAFPGVEGGAWEVSRSAAGGNAARVCVPDIAVLAQWEHRGQPCTRVVISRTPAGEVIHYTCPGGGFGQTKVTMITPRTLRLETQGISGGLPFAYTLTARRVGGC